MQKETINDNTTILKSRSVGMSTQTPVINELTFEEEITYPIIKTTELEYCKIAVHYETSPEIVSTKQDEAIAMLRDVKIPGFRKGKAPDYAIKSKLRPQINQYVARELASSAIDDIVFETNIKPIGQPKFDNVKLDKKFTCDIELCKRPEFKVENIKFDIPRPVSQLDEESLAEQSLYNLRLRVGEMAPYEEDTSVEMGDQVTLSFNATTKGITLDDTTPAPDVDFEGSVVEGEMYTIGANKWSGFDTYLIGMKAGETREFDFVFEDGDLKGKTAHFSVTIHMGTRKTPHPINESFFEQMGVKSIEEIMDKLRQISRVSISNKSKAAIRSQAAIKLIENNKFELPKFLIDAEIDNIVKNSGKDIKTISGDELSKITENAKQNLSLSLILDSVRDVEPDSVLNDNEAKQHLANHIASQGQDPNQLFGNKNAQYQVSMLLHAVKDEFTLQWVADQATIID
jgi:trigger factor